MKKDFQYDVVAVGNAIVDVLAACDDSFLRERGLHKGGMHLVSEDDALDLLEAMNKTQMNSGGSAANTAAGIASFGGKVGYIGKVADDLLGKSFVDDITSIGVDYNTPPQKDGLSTAQCMILITPDAERTMSTFLGASTEFSSQDLNKEMIQSAKVVYLEGYLFDKPAAKDAYYQVAEMAHDAGVQVALSLSDPFCVDRHKEEFLKLVKGHVDILFANEEEIKALFDVHHFDDAAGQVARYCKLAALTRGKEGSVVVTDRQYYKIPASPVEKVKDTTGAGDLYAAGFLYGYTQGFNIEACGRLGSLAAAEIVSHVGARPEVSLQTLAQKSGLAA